MTTAVARTANDRRRYQRLKVQVPGRFMMPDRTEHRCVTLDMSPGGVLLQALVLPYPREKIVVYLDELGRLEGHVTRVLKDRFALRLTATANKMEKTAASLIWLANKDGLDLHGNRRSQRWELAQPGVTLHFDRGPVSGRILNLNAHGAAIAVRCELAVGDQVSIGRSEARVVRVFEQGCAVEFYRPLDPADLMDERMTF